jgi:nitronate monooxygenase
MPPPDLRDLIRRQLVVAPMAGGPSTPDLVAATAEAGAFGFLAGGYKSAAAVAAEMRDLRESTSEPFGINLFMPGRPAPRGRVDAYLRALADDAAEVGEALGDPTWDDDHYSEKLALLLDDPPSVTSFTFGCPDREVVAALHDAGSTVAVTITSPEEAQQAVVAGADLLIVQGIEAGAHQGTFDDEQLPPEYGLLSLIAEVARVTDLPQLAAGGIGGPHQVEAVLAAGAVAAQCGTAFLRCPESGAHPTYKSALADPRSSVTAITRAFSGRRARGIVNQFMLEHRDAPAAYPEINNATRPLRAAAAARGDSDRISLWAGQAFKSASDRPAAEVVELLCRGNS